MGSSNPALPIVLIAAGALVAGILFTRLPSVDLAGPLRMWLWKRDIARMRALRRFPGEIKRSYWTEHEYRVDSERLRGVGYEVAFEEKCEPLAAVPEVTLLGRASQEPRGRRLPAYFVRYVLAVTDARATPQP